MEMSKLSNFDVKKFTKQIVITHALKRAINSHNKIKNPVANIVPKLLKL